MTDRRSFIKNTLLSSAGLIVLPLLSFNDNENNNTTSDELEAGFLNPSSHARPQAYWMWMNGHISKQGITLDLQMMKQIGLAGAFIYNTGTGIVKGPVKYGSEEWKDMLQHAMSEASRLGLELCLHNAPGYSSSGGPWVTPEMSMQQLVWTETIVDSREIANIKLPQPYTQLNYYRDVSVIAFPTLTGEEVLMNDRLARLSVNGKEIEKLVLFDNNEQTFVDLTSKTKSGNLLFEFTEPFEARAVTITRVVDRSSFAYDDIYDHPPTLLLEYSNDGINFHSVCTINMPLMRSMIAPGTKNFEAVKAKFFRLSSGQKALLSSVQLHTAPRLDGWPGKANFTDKEKEIDEQLVAPEFIIDASTIIDLTHKLNEHGYLAWQPPAGSWTVLRMGHTCTGTKNVSAPDEGSGLELDKFSGEAVDYYFQKSLDDFLMPLRSFIPKTFKALLIDSYEVGKQNWTTNFPSEFKQRNGYDLTSWLPALTGRIVYSVANTEKFLFDIRRTQASLMSDNYYGGFKRHCKRLGLEFYAQPYGDGVFDSLQTGQHLDAALAEFWTRYVPGTMGVCDEVVSLAHGYGKKIIPAEAFTGAPATSRWTEYPYALKSQGDHFYSRGINRLVLHVFVHQAYTTGLPGMTMGPYGSHFDRNLTWINYSKAWIDCLARTQYLLQQGVPVADICYFKGEEPTTLIPDVNYTNPPTPRNLAGDVIGRDVLLQRLHIKNKRILLPDGMMYSLLIMAPLKRVSLEVLQRLKELVHEGMTLVVISRPNATPGLKNEDNAIAALAADLWGDLDGKEIKRRSFGQGKIYWNKPFDEVLQEQGVNPDFEFTSSNGDAAIHYTHRRWQNAEIYFISNHQRRKELITASFRVKEKQPELFNPESGEKLNAVMYDCREERTYLPLALEPASSLFVVFRHPPDKNNVRSVEKDGKELSNALPYRKLPADLYAHITNNFTISLWIKPDTIAFPGKGILIFPPEAQQVYGEDHAACGLSAGQNGVLVVERDKGPNRDARIVIQYERSLEGWTHLALRYEEGKPSLFLNGKLVASGKASGKTVHPGIGTKPTDELFSAYFEGNSTKPDLHETTLAEKTIYLEFKKGLPPTDMPSPMVICRKKSMTHLTFWQNGNYKLVTDRTESSIEVNSCKVQPIDASWQVKFPPGSGAPASLELTKLISLHRHPNFFVRHFSGTCQYNAGFYWKQKTLRKEQRILLDLGRVEVLAQVILNGKDLGIMWKEPFRIDITKAIVSGKNTLEINVTNLWPNRMIGDAHLPSEVEYDEQGFIKKLPEWYVKNQVKPGKRISFSTWNNFKKNDPLLESGLLGPVRLFVGLERYIE